MKTIRNSILALLVIAACRETTPDEEHERHREEHAAHSEPRVADDLLRIEAEMLRDLRVTTMPAERRPGGEGFTALGELRVDEEAYAEIAAPHAARVVKALVQPGDAVEPGRALVELWSVELGKARADFLRAEARAGLARQVLERRRKLARERIVPQRELDEAEAEAEAASADLAAARTRLRALGVAAEDVATGDDSGHFILRSPIRGSVIERRAVQGQTADPAAALFRVADLSRLWLVVHAFERDAVRISTGASARASFPAIPGRVFRGVVSMIGMEVDVSSRTIPVRIDVANDEGLLRPGMSATAWLPLGDAGDSVVTVPSTALQRLRDGWCLFLPRGEGVFETRAVGRGRDLGGEVEIVSGLAPGETVVVEGSFLLKAEAERASGAGGHHDH